VRILVDRLGFLIAVKYAVLWYNINNMKQLDNKFWNKYFQVYDVLNMVIPYQELLDDLIKELDVKKGDLILDAGSGTGNLSIKLEKLGAKVIALDNNSEAIKRHKQKNPNAEIVFHDLNKPLPFKDDYFDKIVCNNTLYLFDYVVVEKILTEFYRILKKNGICVLSNPKKRSNPFKIFFEHTKKGFKFNKFLASFSNICKLLKYNYIILKYNKNKKNLGFITTNKQEHLMRNVNFNKIFSKISYSNNAIISKGVK